VKYFTFYLHRLIAATRYYINMHFCMSLSVLPRQLEQAGFLPAVGLPSGTTYEQGKLYVCLTPKGTLRLYMPDGEADVVELSSGNLYDPIIHYAGPVSDTEELFRLMDYARDSRLAS